MIALQWIAFGAGLVLQLLLIRLLLRGSYRQYPFLLLLVLAEFLAGVVSAAARLGLPGWTGTTARYFWMSELVEMTLIYCCLVHIFYQTLDARTHQVRLLHVGLGGIAFAVLSVLQAHDEKTHLWMTQLMRNLSFGSMIVAAMVWGFSIRRANRQRLLIVAGLGVQLAGTAIGHSLRQISRSTVTVGNLILLVCYLLFLYTLWRALSSPNVGIHSPGVFPKGGNDGETASTLAPRLAARETHSLQ